MIKGFFILLLLLSLEPSLYAQKSDTLIIRLYENRLPIGDVIKNQYAIVGLKRHFVATIDSVEYQFGNPNLLKKAENLYLISLGYSPKGAMLIAIPAYVDSLQKPTYELPNHFIKACLSVARGTICEFSFDTAGNILGCVAFKGYGQNENCLIKSYKNIPFLVDNMYLNGK